MNSYQKRKLEIYEQQLEINREMLEIQKEHLQLAKENLELYKKSIEDRPKTIYVPVYTHQPSTTLEPKITCFSDFAEGGRNENKL